MNNKILIEVAYAALDKQNVISLKVDLSSSIEEAIQQSGILILFPEIDLTKQKVGVFGKMRHLDDKVQAGDRIEIYRPLTIDPKDARRAKAKRLLKK